MWPQTTSQFGSDLMLYMSIFAINPPIYKSAFFRIPVILFLIKENTTL